MVKNGQMGMGYNGFFERAPLVRFYKPTDKHIFYMVWTGKQLGIRKILFPCSGGYIKKENQRNLSAALVLCECL